MSSKTPNIQYKIWIKIHATPAINSMTGLKFVGEKYHAPMVSEYKFKKSN